MEGGFYLDVLHQLFSQDKHINILLQNFYENLIRIPIEIYKTILYALVLPKR